MTKLLMISGDRMVAAGKYGAFYNTLEEFHKHWERIDIICPRVTSSKFQDSIFGNVFIHSSPWPLIFQPWFIIKKGLEIFKNNKFDVFTVQDYPPFYNGIGARMLYKKTRAPYMTEIHHIPGFPKASGFKESFYVSLSKLFIRHITDKAKIIRVVNLNQTGSFLKNCGIPSDKIRYIPSFYIDLGVFKPMDLSKEYDLIFIGRLEKNKGIDLLLAAVKNLKYQMPNIKCLIVGDGSLGNYCKSEIVNWKLQNNILVYGWAKDSPEIAKLLNQSRVLIMPSYNEGGPRVVLEAMACGVPVLATPVGIVPDIIKSGVSGEIINWDANDISEKAKKLLSDNDKYEKYKTSGIEIAQQFEKNAAIKNYAEHLISICSKSTY